MKAISRFLLLLTGLMFAVPWNQSVDGAPLYDPTVYQTGQTVGKKHYQITASISATPITYAGLYDQQLVDSHGDPQAVLTVGLFKSVSGNTDLGGSLYGGRPLYSGFATDWNTVGARVFVKHRLTRADGRMAVSAIVAITYARGATDHFPPDRMITSATHQLGSAEFRLPLSYDLGPNVDLVVEPEIVWLMRLTEEQTGFNTRMSTFQAAICPALAGGLRIGHVLSEITLMNWYDHWRVIGGLGVSF